MQNVHVEDLTAWAKRFGVDLPHGHVDQIRTLADQYLERVNALRQVDLADEPLLSPHWVPEEETSA